MPNFYPFQLNIADQYSMIFLTDATGYVLSFMRVHQARILNFLFHQHVKCGILQTSTSSTFRCQKLHLILIYIKNSDVRSYDIDRCQKKYILSYYQKTFSLFRLINRSMGWLSMVDYDEEVLQTHIIDNYTTT